MSKQKAVDVAESSKPPDTPQGRGLRVWFKSEWHQPAIVLGGVLGTISGVVGGGLPAVLLVLGSVAALGIGSARSWKHRSDLRDARAEISVVNGHLVEVSDALDESERRLSHAMAQTKKIYWAMLALTANELEFGNTERISVYVHDPELASFQMVSRFSTNPTLQQAGRGVYSDQHGIIGMAWRDGEAAAMNLPDWGASGDDYVAENLSRFGLPEVECRRITMRPRSLLALRFPTDQHATDALGVVVLESHEPDWASDLVMAKLKELRSWTFLRDHLDSTRGSLPLLSGARDRGF